VSCIADVEQLNPWPISNTALKSDVKATGGNWGSCGRGEECARNYIRYMYREEAAWGYWAWIEEYKVGFNNTWISSRLNNCQLSKNSAL